jgi:hypothetical protein
MKKIIAILTLSLSLSAFASEVANTVQRVEMEQSAKCEYVRSTTISRCFGSPSTCFYSMFYQCSATERDFSLTLRIREHINPTSGKKIIKVRKVIIK